MVVPLGARVWEVVGAVSGRYFARVTCPEADRAEAVSPRLRRNFFIRYVIDDVCMAKNKQEM